MRRRHPYICAPDARTLLPLLPLLPFLPLQLLLPNSAATQCSWVGEVQKTVLWPAHGNVHPEPARIDYYGLTGIDSMSWVAFETVIIVQDR